MTAPEQTRDREAALAEFGRKMEEYERSYDSVPDEALSYVPQGEGVGVSRRLDDKERDRLRKAAGKRAKKTTRR